MASDYVFGNPRTSVRGFFAVLTVAAQGGWTVPTARKQEAVGELQDRVSRCTISIGAQYSGLTVAEMTVLRRRMRDAGVEVRVVKNTLLKRAADAAGRPGVAEVAKGPTAVIF